MSEEIVEYIVNNYEDELCERCQRQYECTFNTNPYNLCEGIHCENIQNEFLDDNMYEILDKVCKENKQLQQENKELKERIDKAIEYMKNYIDVEEFNEQSEAFGFVKLSQTIWGEELLEILEGDK